MYTKKHIDIITLIFVILIFILMNIYQFKNKSNIEKIIEQSNTEISNVTEESKKEIVEEINIIEETDAIEETTNEIEEIPVPIAYENMQEVYPEDWFIKIPKIDLIAEIRNGTSDENLNKYVGHFEQSPVLEGNICLAAHNRGYDVNYFENIKKLLLNDIIIYRYEDIEKIYSVSNITIINEEDWSYIENSNNNQITLITCVENEPTYRLCVQAREIKGDVNKYDKKNK